MIFNKHGVIELKESFQTTGATGTEISGGTIVSDDLSSEWSTRTKYRNIDKMRRTDGMVNAILMAHELMLLQATQIIEPASTDNIDMKIAEDTEEFLFHNPSFDWEYIHRHILKNWIYGFYLFYKEPWRDKRNGRDIVNFKLSPRKPETIEEWHQTNDGQLEKIIQFAQIPNGGWERLEMKNRNCVLFNSGREGDNYEGESFFRPIWRNFQLKDLLMRMDGIGHETWAYPTLVGKLPETVQDDDKDDFKNVLENQRVHEKGYIVLPNGFELDLLTSKNTDGTKIWESIQGNNKEMTSAFLANFIMVGMSEAGTYNLVENKQDLFMRAIQGLGNAIENTINDRFETRAVIRDFVDSNYDGVIQYPKFKYAKIASTDLQALADALVKFSQTGMFFNDSETQTFIRKEAGLPETADDAIPQKKIPQITTEQQKEDVKTEKDETKLSDCNCHIELEDALPFKLNREMTDFERDICCVDKIADRLETFRNKSVSIGDQFRKSMISKLVGRGRAMLSRKNQPVTDLMRDVKGFAGLIAQGKGLSQRDFIVALTKELREVWKFGRGTVKDEIQKQTKKLQDEPETADEIVVAEGTKTIRPEAELAVATLALKLANEWKGEMVRQKKQGIINTVALKKVLEDLTKNDFKRQMTARVGQTFGEGRTFQTKKFHSQDIEMTIIRSEIMDPATTCPPCAAINGREFGVEDSLFQLTSAGAYDFCDSNHGGMNNCRGVNFIFTEG